MVFGQPKGYITVLPEIKHSREPGRSPLGDYSLTEDYFQALRGKTVPVIDIAVDGSSFLVLGDGEKSGNFLWDIDKRDTSGILIPYSLLHPGPTPEDVIAGLKILLAGPPFPCQNFMNQPAIDRAIREHNQQMGEDFYTEGTNACLECRGEPLMGVHRICYKAPEKEVKDAETG